MKSWMNDVAVTLSTLVVAGCFALLYYEDVNGQLSEAGRKPIGTVTYSHNEAQRRFGDRAVWEQVESSAPLYNLDSIRTVADSEVVIRLIDGTQITMSPNTLITLDWGAKAKAVNFLGGSITAIRSGGGQSAAGPGGAAGLVITSGRSKVTLDDASVNLSQGAAGKVDVSVASGEASLSSGGAVQTVSASEIAHLDTATGSASITTSPLVPLSPPANAIVVTQRGYASIPFGWRSSLGPAAYTVQLSEDPGFRRTSGSFTTSGTSLTESVAPGAYYWRILASGQESTPVRLTVLADSPIVTQTPVEGASFGYDVALPLIDFSWSPSGVASGYTIQVATDPKFDNVVESEQTTTNAVTVATLGAGSYFWRVEPAYAFASSASAPASRAASFRVVRDARLKAPSLVAPAPGAELNTLAINSTGLLFNWQADPAMASWHLTVARNPEMTSKVLEETTADNFYLRGAPLDPGTYYWQVRGTDGNGVQTPVSELRAFSVHRESATIHLKSPSPNFDYDGSTFSNVPVVWSSDVLGTYEVQLSTKADFSALFNQIKTTFNNASFGSLPPGTYFWHVLLLGSDGSTLLPSGDESFTVMPPLVAPLAVSPAPGKSIDLINAPSLEFRWDGDPRSQFYDFALYGRGPGGRNRILAQAADLTSNDFVFDDLSLLAPGGGYTWEVKAHNPAGASLSAQESLPTLADFTIRELRIIPPPRLVSPGLGEVIDGPSALDSGVTFKWISPDLQGVGLLDLATKPDFSQTLKQIVVNPGSESVSVAELLPGTYYWRVRAHTRDGLEAPPSKVGEFVVALLPPLAQPYLVTPPGGSVVDMWNKSSLDFSWSRAPDATGYSLSLTELSTGRQVFSVSGVQATSFRYTDLQNLNVGQFVWRLTATQSDSSGQVVRSSRPLATRFEIVLGNKIGPARITSPNRFFVH